MRLVVLLGLLALALAACARVVLVEPGRHPVGDAFTVETPIAWSAFDKGKFTLWTVDGPDLEALRIIAGLDDGEPMLPAPPDDYHGPRFRAGMTASEAAEFIVDSLAAGGLGEVVSSDLAPAPFGDREGFRFDLSFRTADGLEMKGQVLGAVVAGRLYALVYTATRLHYFEAYRAAVEHVFASVQGG